MKKQKRINDPVDQTHRGNARIMGDAKSARVFWLIGDTWILQMIWTKPDRPGDRRVWVAKMRQLDNLAGVHVDQMHALVAQQTLIAATGALSQMFHQMETKALISMNVWQQQVCDEWLGTDDSIIVCEL